MTENNYSSEFIRFVTIEGPKIKPYATKDRNGNDIYLYDLELMSIIAKYLGVRYEILTPLDGQYGVRLPDGNWTGMIGMIERKEAELAMSGIAVTVERFSAVNYSYPYLYSTLTFMTDAPAPMPKNLAIFYPFPYGLWIALIVLTLAMSLVFYILLKRRESYQRVLLSTISSTLGNSVDLRMRNFSGKMAVFTWILGMFVITNSYRAVLLSFLSFPTMIGIRDISDLSKAVSTESFKCIAPAGTYMIQNFVESGDPSLKAIGECLIRNKMPGDFLENFVAAPPRKAYLGSKLNTVPVERLYFVSEDNFYIELYGIPFSKTFCCPEDLNRLIHRFISAGIFEKLLKEYNFFMLLQTLSLIPEYLKVSSVISLVDLSGAFYILVSGWAAGFVALLTEILIQKYN